MLLRTILAATTVAAALLVPATAAVAAPPGRTGQSVPAPPARTAQPVTAATAGAAVAAPTSTPVPPLSAAARAANAGANPVIVVGGLIGISIAYEPIAARLRADGYRTSIYELSGLGFGDIRANAGLLKAQVDAVRAATGAARVDLVAHSEGGLVARWYVKFLGGDAAVGRFVSLGSPQQGTYVANILKVIGLGSCAGIVACQQMSIGSDLLAELNAGDDTPGPVRWTTVRTWQDELVRPVGNASLADGATNVLIQAWCPLWVVGHLGLVLDGTTYTVVRQALSDNPIRPACLAL